MVVYYETINKSHLDTFVYYESIKRDPQTKPVYECRCDERLKTKTEKYTRLVYTGLHGELEHLKIMTRLIDEMFVSVISEYVFLFIINRQNEIYRQNLHMSVGVIKE